MGTIRGVSSVKFQLGITIEDDDGVKIESTNPGAVNPYFIIGVLDKIKTEIILATESNKKEYV